MELLTFLVAFFVAFLAVHFYANENDRWKTLLTRLRLTFAVLLKVNSRDSVNCKRNLIAKLTAV